ncbi:MAG: hypothetical protein ACR2PK_14355 [Acidimicrobiales bacterium]
MGQPVTVVQKASSRPGVVRFEINRSITGMGHERYRAEDPISGDRPPDVLARTLFEQGGVDGIHINSNVITIDLGKGSDASSLKTLIEEMFIYYGAGVEVPSFPQEDA